MRRPFVHYRLLALIVALAAGTSIAQQAQNMAVVSPQPWVEPCGVTVTHQELMQTNPVYAQSAIDFQNYLENLPISKSTATYQIPVVVHIMDAGNGLTDITDQEIYMAIQGLNQRYRKIAGSIGDGNGVDVDIEFSLAVRDPSGNCTNGIVRYDLTGNATYVANGVFRNTSGMNDVALKALSFWNSNNYYNIWVISEIDNNNGGSGVQGYASFAFAHGSATDGTIILNNAFKNINSVTLAHELGHALNVYHTFQDDSNGAACPPNADCLTEGDLVCDIPPHMRSTGASPCVTGSYVTNTCTGGSNSEHVHNYMDYSADYCQNEFTQGQKTRMIAALTGIRASFLASNGNLSLVPPSTATVQYTAGLTAGCVGSIIQFYDNSICTPNNFLLTSNWNNIIHSWVFDNGSGTIINSSEQNPLIAFGTAGTYSVTLTITNPNGTTSFTNPSGIIISSSPTNASCLVTSTATTNFPIGIFQFLLEDINHESNSTINDNTSGLTVNGYADFTCTELTTLDVNTNYPVSWEGGPFDIGAWFSQNAKVYIDYNNDGDFTDPGEEIASWSGIAGGSGLLTQNFTTPLAPVTNIILRARVIVAGGAEPIDPCMTTNLGQSMDFGVLIQSACTLPLISISGFANPSTCSSNDGTITIGGTGSGNVSWTGTASGSAAGVSLPYTITGLGAGNYDITYGIGGCVSSAVNQTLSAPGGPAVPVINASGPITFCDGGSVDLTSSYASGNTWSTLETTQTITVTTSGTYSIIYSDGGGCTSTSLPITVTVNATPAAPTISPAGAVSMCPGGSINLTSSESIGNLWSTTEITQTIAVNSAGSHTVTYTDANNCTSLPSAATVVTLASSVPLPLVEGFVSATFLPVNWTEVDAGGSGNWVRSTTVGNIPTAGNSMQFDNFTHNDIGSNDEVHIEPLDFQGVSNAQLAFDVAHARYNTSNVDGLEVLISTDCGSTFTSVYLKSGTVLATDPDQTSAYSPGNWRNEVVDLSAYDGQSSVIVAFRNIAGYGNNVYVDNINIQAAIICNEPDLPTVSATPVTVCDGVTSILTINGNLNDAIAWNIYTGSCGGTLVGTTATSNFTVTPVGPSTTYYVRGEGGCATPGTCGTVTVAVNPIPSAPTVTVVDNCGSSTLTATGSSLVWSTTETTSSITVNAAGSYTVTQTVGGCTSAPGSVVATPIMGITIAQGTVVNTSSCGASDGSIEVTGTGSGTVNWTGVATGTSGVVTLPYTITGLSAGSYTITIDNGCVSNTLNSSIVDPSAPAAPIITVVDNCGSSTLTATGSGLLWSTTETTPSITVNAAGTYTVTQTVGGCTSVPGSVVATPIIAISIAQGTVVNTSSCGGSDGSIQVTGTGSGTVNWTGTATGTSGVVTLPYTITGLSTGSYTITIDNGCVSNTLNSSIVDPSAPAAPIITVVDNCGSSTLTAAGSGLLWSTTETTPSITVSTAGSYTVTQTVGGCTSAPGSGITNPTPVPPAPSVTVVDNCGSSTLTATGSNLVWSTTETTSSITVNAAGTYTVTQTIGGCTSAPASGVTNPTSVPSAPSVTVVDNCGSSTLTATGSNLLWSTTETTSSITVNTAGTYTVNQTVGGCTSAAASGVTNPTPVPSAPSVTVVDNCGSSTLTATGSNLLWSTTETTSSITVNAAGTYIVTQTIGGCTSAPASGVTNPTSVPPAPSVTVVDNCGLSTLTATGSSLVWSTTETTSSITVNTAGTYTVTQTVGGCTSAPASGVTNPTSVPSAPSVTVVDNCGSSTLSATGSSLLWSTTETTSSITVNAAGTYTVTQTIGGCTSAPASGVTNPTSVPSAPSVTVVDNCGSSTLTATGSNLLWSTTETTSSITVNTAGTYTVNQTVGGCTSAAVSGVAAPLNAILIAQGTVVNASSCGAADGTIEVTGSGTGNISWTGTASGNAASVPLPYVITGLAAGFYDITFVDGNGCTSNTFTQAIVDGAAPPAPVITSSGPVTFCTGGSVDLTSSYGTNNVWSTTDVTPTITVTTSGSYTVTYTDGFGCSSISAPIAVVVNTAPVAPTITPSGTTTFCAGGSVDLVSSQPTGNNWSTAEATQVITVSTTGTYDVTYTDGNGCSTISTPVIVTVNAIPAPPTITPSGSTALCTGGTVDLTSSEPTGNTWSTAEITPTITVSTTGTYDITYIDGNGCTSTSAPINVTINANPSAPTITASGSTTLCVGQTIDLTSSEAIGNVWSTTEVTATISVGATGAYSVTYTDPNGCSAVSAPISVFGDNQPTVYAGPDQTVCEGESVTLTGAGAVTYVWDNSVVDNVPFNPAVGSILYSVTGIDGNGCTNTASVTVTVSATPTPTLTTDISTCVGYGTSTLVGLPAGGVYLGSNVSGDQFNPTSAGVGTHTIHYEFTNATGCFGTTSTTILVEACVSLDELVISEPVIYPNPVSTELNIEFAGELKLQLFDTKGAIVYSDEMSNHISIPVNNFSAGIYILNMVSEDKHWRKRVVIK